MEKAINWIKEERISGLSWNAIRLAGETNEADLAYFLKYSARKYHWPELTIQQWFDLVDEQRRISDEAERLRDDCGATVIGDVNETNDIEVPTKASSAWQTYRRKLKSRNFSQTTIDSMESSTLEILRRLSRDTREIGPVKGLVVGNVQSGKTANMAALMAMAADCGWNMFIILSGTLNNLREQTQKRLLSDLQDDEWNWGLIDQPESGRLGEFGKRLRDKKLDISSKYRYFTVCLKNSTRLSNLVDWLNDSQKRGDVKMLIIDDEADQASINTASKDERTKINQLILNLINNRTSKGRECSTAFGAVNYIGYTATPYANVLNEGPRKESLYPANFIAALPVSDEYFGPQQIFGCDIDEADKPVRFNGLDIIRTISDEDSEIIDAIHQGITTEIPESLKNSICWFMCGVGHMRQMRYSKPVSMLVHTKLNVDTHEWMASAITNWLNKTTTAEIIDRCRTLWLNETQRFNIDIFRRDYPAYAESATGHEINDYAPFEAIEPQIRTLLSKGLTNIRIDEEGRREYNDGIHICIDNSSNNNTTENTTKRLIYPDDDSMPETAPAFLVIGGNTLSRGLTIEGLISTFFLRPARCSDTLMQMGRWFGYRRGYELIPRIWLTEQTKQDFEYIAEMDQKLRDEIRYMDQLGISPTECGPKIMKSPSTISLRIVAENKSKEAVGADYDFAGHSVETGVFSNDEKTLQKNLKVTARFIESLGTPANRAYNPYAANNRVWQGIPFEQIKDFLTTYKYSQRLRGLNNVEILLKWLENKISKGLYSEWNVILAGKHEIDSSKLWSPAEGISVTKVKRTQRTPHRNDNILNIGVLRSFNDFLSDIEISGPTDGTLSRLKEVKHNTFALNAMRAELGLGSIPQLVIYIIDKDSLPDNGSKRFPLNAVCDIAGFSISIPGFRESKNTVKSTTMGNLGNNEAYDDDIEE